MEAKVVRLGSTLPLIKMLETSENKDCGALMIYLHVIYQKEFKKLVLNERYSVL